MTKQVDVNKSSKSLKVDDSRKIVKKKKKILGKKIKASVSPKAVEKIKPKEKKEKIKETTFETLTKYKVSQETCNAIAEMGLKYMDNNQHSLIYPLLKGRDIAMKGVSSWSKKLCLVLKAVEVVKFLDMKPQHGIGCMLVVPNNESAAHIIQLLKLLDLNGKVKVGTALSGKDKKQELKKFNNGVNIVVATPGRLMNHLKSKVFITKNLQYLVIDEADEIARLGLTKHLHEMLKIIPEQRQSVVCFNDFEVVEKITADLLKANPLCLNDSEVEANSEKETEKIKCLVCPAEKRLVHLYTLLKKYKAKKVLVYFSSSKSCEYHELLLDHLQLKTLAYHSFVEPADFSSILLDYCNVSQGVLLCSEASMVDVSLPHVDAVVYYDQPSNISKLNLACDEMIMMLRQPDYERLVDGKLLAAHDKVTLARTQLSDVSSKVVELNKSIYQIHIDSREAYKAHITAYITNQLHGRVFDVKSMDLECEASSFGIDAPPYVDLDINN